MQGQGCIMIIDYTTEITAGSLWALHPCHSHTLRMDCQKIIPGTGLGWGA